MSSLFLLPLGKETKPVNSLWLSDPRSLQSIQGSLAGPILHSCPVISEGGGWTVKTMTIHPQHLIARDSQGQILSLLPLSFNKLSSGESPIHALPPQARETIEDMRRKAGEVYLSSSVYYLRIHHNPYEEITDTLYFAWGNQHRLFREKMGRMGVLFTDFSDRYLQLSKLGSGTYSKVHLVKCLDSGNLLASKAIDPSTLNQYAQAREIIAGEINILHRLEECAQVPTLWEVHVVNDAICLCMDYIEGVTLGEFVKKKNNRGEYTGDIVYRIFM